MSVASLARRAGGRTVRWRPDRVQAVVLGWALVSAVLSLTPVGFGGVARAVDAVVFLTLGPAVALVATSWSRARRPRDTWSADGGGTAERDDRRLLLAVVGVAVSLSTLLLTSLVLVVLDFWHVTLVVAVVTAVTVALAVRPPGSAILEPREGADDQG